MIEAVLMGKGTVAVLREELLASLGYRQCRKIGEGHPMSRWLGHCKLNITIY